MGIVAANDALIHREFLIAVDCAINKWVAEYIRPISQAGKAWLEIASLEWDHKCDHDRSAK